MKISVIIPIYNQEDYLNECIDSVLNQSLQDFEIICIDDGSTDNTMNILRSYENDSRIKIISKEHSGLGATRNVGLDIAQGEYILFLDSDDYLNLNALESLYDLAVHNSLDCIICKITNFHYITKAESHTEYFDMKFLQDIVGMEIFDWTRVKNHLFSISVTSASKIFKRELLEDIRFPEGLIFEDNLFFIKVLFKAQRLYFLDEYLYYRRIHPNSITNSYYKYFPDCLTIYEMIYDYLKEIRRYDEFRVQLFDRQCNDIFHRFSQCPDEFKDDFFKKIQLNFSKLENELVRGDVLENCDKRSLTIFKSALDLETYREFELSVNVFDLKAENKLNCIQYQNRIDQLTELNYEYSYEINTLKNSNSWKLTYPFRAIAEYFKKKI